MEASSVSDGPSEPLFSSTHHGQRHSSPNFPSSYAEQDMRQISIAHRDTKTWSDWVAFSMVRLLRWGTDIATGYRHDKGVLDGTKDAHAKSAHSSYTMNERKWLVRFVFLESVAGVPGMVAGMLRHLHSLRRMKRDNGW